MVRWLTWTKFRTGKIPHLPSKNEGKIPHQVEIRNFPRGKIPPWNSPPPCMSVAFVRPCLSQISWCLMVCKWAGPKPMHRPLCARSGAAIRCPKPPATNPQKRTAHPKRRGDCYSFVQSSHGPRSPYALVYTKKKNTALPRGQLYSRGGGGGGGGGKAAQGRAKPRIGGGGGDGTHRTRRAHGHIGRGVVAGIAEDCGMRAGLCGGDQLQGAVGDGVHVEHIDTDVDHWKWGEARGA